MPYKDPARQREYMRTWVAKRRADWFQGKVCVECGSTENLELDHLDPATKVTHAIWSWSTERRERELAKCRPLCQECHKKKSAGEHAKGENTGQAILTDSQVLAIKSSELPSRVLSETYDVHIRTIQHIRKGDSWRHIKVA